MTEIETLEKMIFKMEQRLEFLKSGIDPRQCKHGTYTNEPFNTHGCKTCGNPKVVICNHPKVIGKRRNSKGCNAANCKYFQSITSNAVNIERCEHRTR